MSAKRKAEEIICRCPICGIDGVSRSAQDDLTHRLESLAAAHPHVWTAGQIPTTYEVPVAPSDTRPFHVRKRQRLEENFEALGLEARLLEATLNTIVRAHMGPRPNINNAAHMRASDNYQQVSSDAESLRERARLLPISHLRERHSSLAHTISRIFVMLDNYRPPGRILYKSGRCERGGMLCVILLMGR
jgi:hypothetical protein